jgi:H+/Cl- antiporter ClcA
VRRVWVALALLLAALLGFVVGLVGTFFAAFSQDISSECDGPCFSDWVGWVALGGGVVGAVLFSYAAWRYGRRYFAKPS